MIIISLIIATAIPFSLLYLVYQLDLYASRSYKLVLISFIWGGIAVLISLILANQLVFNLGLVDLTTFSRYVAPVSEELIKAAVLIVLVQQSRFTYFVDGAIYGVAAGMGFAIIENALYLSNDPEVGTAVSRVISTNLMHATATGIVGIALGRAHFERFSGRLLWLLLGLTLAIGIHAGFNNLVSRMNGRFLLLYATIIGMAGFGFIIFVIKRGLAEQKQWIEETLSKTSGITSGETAIVQRLDNVYDILTPLATQFGPEKAQAIEAFLMLQARLGILQKTYYKVKDDKVRQGIEAQIVTLQQEIDDARRQVGPYCMVYLRNIFPEQNSLLWLQLEEKINNRAKQPSGTNIWQTVKTRTQLPENE